jgi:general secretion pathway protein F
MPIFHYKGYKDNGSKVSGTIEASSTREAVLKLKEIGLYPIDIVEAIYSKRFRIFSGSHKTLLELTTRQLSILLSSGVTLIESLSSVADESKGYWKNIIINIRDKIESGSSFARALESYKDIFPEYYISMVAAAEASGNLDVVLKQLADYIESQDVIQSKIRISMVYPLFMVFTGFVVLSFLFTFVIPKIVSIFKEAQTSLPWITIILIRVSDLFRNFWWAIVLIVIVIVYLIKRLKEANRLLIDKIIFHLPGDIFKSLYYGRFTRTLGFLLDGGLPVLKALELSAKSTGNKFLEGVVLDAEKRVAEGARLSSSLEGISPVLIQLISTGERSGRLVEILRKAADTYEEDFSRRIQKFISLLEPAMILIMGIIIGFIVLAILLPIFQLNQLIK